MKEEMKIKLAWKTINFLETLIELILEHYTDDQPDPDLMEHFISEEHPDTEPF